MIEPSLLEDMLGKIKAAVDARIDPDLQIIARTDARATQGFEAAIERAQRFAEAGADIILANTFSANRMKLRELGLENLTAELNTAAVKLAMLGLTHWPSLFWSCVVVMPVCFA